MVANISDINSNLRYNPSSKLQIPWGAQLRYKTKWKKEKDDPIFLKIYFLSINTQWICTVLLIFNATTVFAARF